MKHWMTIRIGVLAALSVAAMVQAAPLRGVTVQGHVTRVIDGDSLMVQTEPDARVLEVRLQDIDAPESCQAGGAESRAALAEYVTGKQITLRLNGHDHYGRNLATVLVGDLNVNQRMVAEGQAWSIRTRWNRGPLVAQENMAQALARGLHASGDAIMPSEFRRRHGPCTGPAESPASAPAASNTSGTAAALPTARAVDAAFHCDGRTRCTQMRSCDEAKYFLQHCPGVQMDGDRDGIPCERQWC